MGFPLTGWLVDCAMVIVLAGSAAGCLVISDPTSILSTCPRQCLTRSSAVAHGQLGLRMEGRLGLTVRRSRRSQSLASGVRGSLSDRTRDLDIGLRRAVRWNGRDDLDLFFHGCPPFRHQQLANIDHLEPAPPLLRLLVLLQIVDILRIGPLLSQQPESSPIRRVETSVSLFVARSDVAVSSGVTLEPVLGGHYMGSKFKAGG